MFIFRCPVDRYFDDAFALYVPWLVVDSKKRFAHFVSITYHWNYFSSVHDFQVVCEFICVLIYIYVIYILYLYKAVLEALLSRSSMKTCRQVPHYKATYFICMFLLNMMLLNWMVFGNELQQMWRVTVRHMHFLSVLQIFCTVCRVTLIEYFVNISFTIHLC